MTSRHRRPKSDVHFTFFRNVYIRQFGVLRQKMDIILGIGMAVVVVISKILGTFCDFMIALANIGGIVSKQTLRHFEQY